MASLSRVEGLFVQNLVDHPILDWVKTKRRGSFADIDNNEYPIVLIEPIMSVEEIKQLSGRKVRVVQDSISMLVVAATKGLGNDDFVEGVVGEKTILDLASDVRSAVYDRWCLGPSGTAAIVTELSEIRYTRAEPDGVSILAFTCLIKTEAETINTSV